MTNQQQKIIWGVVVGTLFLLFLATRTSPTPGKGLNRNPNPPNSPTPPDSPKPPNHWDIETLTATRIQAQRCFNLYSKGPYTAKKEDLESSDSIERVYWEQIAKRDHFFKKLLEDENAWKNHQSNEVFWSNFEPYYNCPLKRRVGAVGDGGKWICNMEGLEKENCIVYSFGGSMDASFEVELNSLTGCEIHIFDPTPGIAPLMRESLSEYSNIKYHDFGLNGYSGKMTLGGHEVEVKTLRDTMSHLGHDHVDVLKVDIEGSEWVAYHQMFEDGTLDNVGQTQVEIHLEDFSQFMCFMLGMERQGFRIFSKETNHFCSVCMEFSWTKPEVVKAIEM